MKASLFTLTVAGAMSASTAQACGIRPERLTIAEVSKASDVIVRGELSYAFSEKENLAWGDPGWLVGDIAVEQAIKGPQVESYSIHHRVNQFYCFGAGWEPSRRSLPSHYSGVFYLRRNSDDTYRILLYRP